MARSPLPGDARLNPFVQSRANVVRFCVAAGFRGESLVTAVAVAQAESSFDATVTNYSAAGGIWGPAVGLFQVRVLVNPKAATNSLDRQRDFDSMLDPINNTAFAYTLSKGGRDFTPWSAFTSGAYKKYLDAARKESLTAQPNLTGGAAAIASVNPVTNDWIDTDSPPVPIIVGGGAHDGDLGNSVVSAQVDFTMAEATLASFELEDEDANLLTTSGITEGSALVVMGDRHIVTSVGIKQGPGSPHFVIASQPAGVVRLRGVPPVDAAGSNAVDYVRGLARAAGMDFVGGPPSPAVPIVVADVPLAGSATTTVLDPASGLAQGSRKENAWEVARRLASTSAGYLCFEAAGTLYFATGDYLLKNGGALYVQVGDNVTFGASRDRAAIRSIGYPSITRSIKRDARNQVYRHVDVTLDLPPGPGYAARPGMRLILAEPSGIAIKARPILINQVTVAIGDQTQVVRVTAASVSAPGDTAGDLTTSTAAVASGSGVTNVGDIKQYVGAGISQNGWPASQHPERIPITSWPIAGTGVTLQLASRAGPVLSFLASEFHLRVEPLVPGICGGYSYRGIPGSQSLSNHASGTAIDLNWSRHAYGLTGTFTPTQLAALRSILARINANGQIIRWGGDYKRVSNHDEMHFEIVADPNVLAKRF